MPKYDKLGIIIFPIFCLLISFAAIITDANFTYLLLDNPEAVQPTKQLMRYYAGMDTMPEVFHENEQSHLIDVRNLIYGAFALLILLTIIYFQMDWRKTVKKGTILLVTIILAGAIIPFNRLFTYFHYVMFPMGNWMFEPKSTLISFYPNTFFANYTIAIALTAIATATLFLFLSQLGDKKNIAK